MELNSKIAFVFLVHILNYNPSQSQSLSSKVLISNQSINQSPMFSPSPVILSQNPVGYLYALALQKFMRILASFGSYGVCECAWCLIRVQ